METITPMPEHTEENTMSKEIEILEERLLRLGGGSCKLMYDLHKDGNDISTMSERLDRSEELITEMIQTWEQYLAIQVYSVYQ